MPYYCTVPQCTSLAGKAKNVSFHQFPRDDKLALRWNEVLRRDKPYTKYSKVCSLHFTADDYTMTHMGKNKGQWKTLNKDAIPSQNLPKLNPDGTVMVLRKSRSPKYTNEDHNNGQNHPQEGNDPPSIFTLAKEYLSGRPECKQEPWYQHNGEDAGHDDGMNSVKIKEEYPDDDGKKKRNKKKAKVQTVDATIQTDLCQEGIGFRKGLLDCPTFPSFFPQPDTAGMTNYFQTNTNEPLSLPKDPLHQAGYQECFGSNGAGRKTFFYTDTTQYGTGMIGAHSGNISTTNRNH